MRVGWALAAALAATAALGGLALVREEPPTPDPSSPSGSGLAVSPDPVLGPLEEARRAGRWADVLALATAALERESQPARRWRVASTGSRAAWHLQLWVECDRFAGVCQELEGRFEPDAAGVDERRLLLGMRARALLALDRTLDAVRLLDRSADAQPGLRADRDWLGLRLAASVVDPIWFDLYRGQLSDAGRIAAGRRRFETAVAEGLERIRRRTGDPGLTLPRLAVGLLPPADANSDWAWMAASGVRRGSEWTGVILSRPEFFEHPTMQDTALLAHELTHVLHQSLTWPSIEPPLWLREGLAHWIEADDETFVRERVLGMHLDKSSVFITVVPALLPGVAFLDSEDEESERVRGALLFFWLERTRGTTAVGRLARGLLGRADYAAVFKEHLGLEVPRLLADARAAHAAWLGEAFRGREQLSLAGAHARAGRLVQALTALDAFLANAGDAALRPYAEALRLECLIRSEAWPEAEAALAPIRARRATWPLHCLVDDGVALEFVFLRKTEAWPQTVALAREARDSLWVRAPRERAALDRILAEAEKHLAESAPPK